MAKCSKNLRAKRRRRLKAEAAVRRRLVYLADECFGRDELLLMSLKEVDALQGKVASLDKQLARLAAAVDMVLNGRLLLKVMEGVLPGTDMVRVRYRHPDMAVRVPVAVPPEEAFAAVGERIARKVCGDPLAVRTVLSQGFAEEFYREFLSDAYGDEVMASLRHLGDQLAVSIFAGVCLNSVKLAVKLQEVNRE